MKWIMTMAFAALTFSASAHATGGFSCTIDDGNLQFEAEAALGSMVSSPILNLRAQAKSRISGTPNDLRELDLTTFLAHSWMIHPELRLQFYREREGAQPHGTFELVLTTKASDDEGNYAGDYNMTVFYTEPPAEKVEGTYLKATGKVSCFVE